MGSRGWSATKWVLIVIVLIGLAIQAIVHFALAPDFAKNATQYITEPWMFRGEAIAAIVVGLALLLHPRRYTAVLAFIVTAAGAVAVFVYRYVDIGRLGPIPGMFDPYWAPPAKVISAVAEAVAALVAIAVWAMLHRESRRRADDAPIGLPSDSRP